MVIAAAQRLGRRGREKQDQSGNMAIVMVRGGQDQSHRCSGKEQEVSDPGASDGASLRA